MLKYYRMWGWIAGAAALLAVIAAAVNLDFIHKADTLITAEPSQVQKTLPMEASASSSSLTISSAAFEDGGIIPARYTCDASSSAPNPPLSISGVPAEAVSLALIMDDPDVPKQLKPDGMFDHWVLFNIPATTTAIGEGESPGILGANGAGSASYYGPCPPKQYQPSEHRYFFKLYALDTMLDLPAGASKAQVEQAMQGHVVLQAQLIARYKRP